MNMRAIVCVGLLLIVLIAPVAADNDQRYGYISLESVQIQLHNDTAIIDMHYSVDEGTRIIFFLLGEQDLKNKLETILNFNNTRMEYINLTNAEFAVGQASYSYGNGIYWFPTHQFNLLIPKLAVSSPQVIRNYSNTNLFPEGMGYFDPVMINQTPPQAPSIS